MSTYKVFIKYQKSFRKSIDRKRVPRYNNIIASGYRNKAIESESDKSMFKRLIKRLATAYQANRLAKQNLLRNRYNRNQINLILKDIEERAI